MIAELRPEVSPFLLEGIMQRAEGRRYPEIARDMGRNPRTFADSLRQSCMDETGFTTITGTTAWLINQRLINLSSVTEGRDLSRVAAIPAVDQIILNNVITNPPNPTDRKEIQRIDRDFDDKKDINPAIAAVGANNMAELLVLVAAFSTGNAQQDQITVVKPLTQETQDRTNNSGDRKRKPKAVYRPLTEVTDKRSFLVHYRYELDGAADAEKPDKLIGRVLTQQQASFITLDAQGYIQAEIPAMLGISPKEYYAELNAALDALQPYSYNPSLQTQEEVNSARRITIANLMMESGEIDSMAIARRTYASPQELLNAFQTFTALKVRTLELVAQGRTLSSIMDEASRNPHRYGEVLTKNSLEQRVHIVREKIKANTTTQAVVFYRAYQKLLRYPMF